MAASHVTISAFLELRDNMSAGVKAVSSEIDRLNRAAKDAEDAIRRMKAATRIRPPPAGPPAPPGRAAPSAPGTPRAPMGRGGVFGDVLSANLIADAIENAVVSATRAVAGLLKYTVKVGQEYENTQLRITNVLASMNLAPTVRAASSAATEVLADLREMAAKLPGEAKDYYNVFAMGLPNAVASGMKDVKKYADFAGRYTATAISFGVDAPQAGRDLSEMLRGVATARTKTFQELRTFIGMTAKEFNKLTPEKKMQLLQTAIEKASGGMAMAAETANAKFGELQSRIDEIFIVGGKPFFEGVKSVVTDLNTLLKDNKQQIIDTTKLIATGFGDSLRGVLIIAKDIGSTFSVIGDMVGVIVKKFGVLGTLMQIPGGLAAYQAANLILVPGAAERVAQETAARQKALAEQEAVRTKYAWAGMPRVTEFIGAPYATESTEALMAMRSAEQTLKRLAPVERNRSFFESRQDWETFAQSMGFDLPSINRIWRELIDEGAVKVSAAPLTVREVNVNFNNNRFDIRQAFAEGFDPDRIAVAFASDLGRLGEFQMQSALAPYASVQ